MTAVQFCFWLNGYLELSAGEPDANKDGLSRRQLGVVARHLGMVFLHDIDKTAGDEKHQQALNDLHHGGDATGEFLVRC